jgi:starch synthase
VGGVGDVLRGLPLALAERGWQPIVLTPAYGMFNKLPGAEMRSEISVEFGGAEHSAEVWGIHGPDPRVEHLAIEHALLSPAGPGKIYCADPPGRPFARDATKFAFFAAAAAALVRDGAVDPDVVHLHDWHAGLYTVIRSFMPGFSGLRQIRTVFTIHNLALQGIRPLAGDESSLQAWFPGHHFPLHAVVDPRYSDCVNPMAAAIRLADMVNTVSPTYAQEILLPSNAAHGFIAGEGLEADLREVEREGRLIGILNGCEYPRQSRRRPGWQRLLTAIDDQIQAWRLPGDDDIQSMSAASLARLPKRRPASVLVSIGRLTAQKTALFLERTSDGKTALEAILDRLGKKGVLIMLGSGDLALEKRVAAVANEYKNFLFLYGYSGELAELLYKAGDLFLMPSSFEPCGISQMIAMRAAQPCVVHGVGGLRDTVEDGVTGFVFDGATTLDQADAFVAATDRALTLQAFDKEAWSKLRNCAATQRFSWDIAAEAYEQQFYVPARS